MFTAVASPMPSLCPISHPPMSVPLLHLLPHVPAAIPSPDFSTLHHCAGVVNIPLYLEPCLLLLSVEKCRSPSQTNKCKTETGTWSVTEIATAVKMSKANADQEEFRQDRPDVPPSWGLANSGQTLWPFTCKGNTVLQGFTATNKELMVVLFCCIYLLSTRKNPLAKLGRIHAVLLWGGSCSCSEPCGKLVPDLETG